MHKTITKSKDMDSPCDNVIILVFFHVLPGKFMPVSEHKIMNVELSTSCKNISFSTKLLSSAHSNNLYFNCIDVIVFKVGEVHNNFFKAVIRSTIEYNGFVG